MLKTEVQGCKAVCAFKWLSTDGIGVREQQKQSKGDVEQREVSPDHSPSRKVHNGWESGGKE